MRTGRLHFHDVQRIVLCTALLPVLGLNALSAEAIVIHRHGGMDVHIHVLTAGDLAAEGAQTRDAE
jgi:hypothetical protein